MRVAVVQMDVQTGDVARNLASAKDGIREALRRKAQVVVLPELWDVGYVWREDSTYPGSRSIQDFAKPLAENAALDEIKQLAAQNGIWMVAGSLPERTAAGIYNTAVIIDRQGNRVHRYRKVHLIGLMDEPEHLESGAGNQPFLLEGIRAGIIICYDLRFPESMRSLIYQGAKVIFVVAQWPKIRINHWKTLIQARAIENQCYVIAANRVGQGGPDEFPGASMVVDPMGTIQIVGGDAPCVLTDDLDLDRVCEVRRQMPVLNDVNPPAYRTGFSSAPV